MPPVAVGTSTNCQKLPSRASFSSRWKRERSARSGYSRGSMPWSDSLGRGYKEHRNNSVRQERQEFAACSDLEQS